MATSYGDLENRDGTIYNKKTGKGYSTPAALATDMGIAPHEINWGNIGAWTPPASAPKVETKPLAPVAGVVNGGIPIDTGVAQKQPATIVPAQTPQANYSGLVNVNGEIQTADGRKFKDPTELAGFLGIDATQIDWGQIPQGAGTPTTPTAPPEAPPTTKTTRSLIDIANSRPDVLATAKAQGGDPFTAGTPANNWLNNWWNTAGKNEFPDVILGPPEGEQEKLTKEANDFQTQLFDNLPEGDIDPSESQKLIDDFLADIEAGEYDIEKPPSQAELFATTKETLGMEPLEEDLARIDSEIDLIDSELLIQQGQLTSGQDLVTSGQLGRRKGTLQKEADDRKLRLNIEKGIVVRQLNNKINTLNMIMQFSQQDYQNAATYQKAQFDRATKMYDLISGAEDRERTIEEKAEDDAKANWTVIYGAIEAGQMDYDSLTDDQKIKIRQLELEAGFPIGMMHNLKLDSPDQDILTTTSRTDSSGGQWFDVLMQSKDGEMTVKSVYKGAGKVASSRSGDGYSQKDLDKIERDRIKAEEKAATVKEKAFWTEIDQGKALLQKGENWGSVWNRIKTQFPEIPNEVIDQVLGKEDWYEKGAYEKFKAKGKSGNDIKNPFE